MGSDVHRKRKNVKFWLWIEVLIVCTSLAFLLAAMFAVDNISLHRTLGSVILWISLAGVTVGIFGGIFADGKLQKVILVCLAVLSVVLALSGNFIATFYVTW